MCPSGFHHNGFVGQMAYGYNCWYNKLIYIYVYIYIYICIYIYVYIYVCISIYIYYILYMYVYHMPNVFFPTLAFCISIHLYPFDP